MRTFLSAIILMTLTTRLVFPVEPWDQREQLREFFQQEILPKLQQWKTEFDRQLKPEDLKHLNQLRQQAEQLRQHYRQQRHKLRQQLKQLQRQYDQWQAQQQQLRQHLKELTQKHREQMRPLIEEAQKLARQYRQQLKELLRQARPQIQQWRQRLDQLRQQWNDTTYYKRYRHWLFPYRRIPIIRFLLWNGIPNPEFESSNLSSDPPVLLLSQQNFHQMLSSHLAQLSDAAPIQQLALFDLRGNLVSQGDPNFLPTTRPLPSGQYILSIQFTDGQIHRMPLFLTP